MKAIPLFNGYLSVRWKLIIPYLVTAALVIAVLIPVTTTIVSNEVEGEADRRLTELAESVAVLIEQSEDQARFSAQFIARLPEMIDSNLDRNTINTVMFARKDELDLQEVMFFTTDFERGDAAYAYAGPVVTRRGQTSSEKLEIIDKLVLSVIDSGETANAIALVPQSSEVYGAAPVFNADGEMQGVILAGYFVNNTYMQAIADVVNADVALVKANAVIALSILGEEDDVRLAQRADSYEKLIRDGFTDSETETPSRNIEVDDQPQRLIARPLVVDGRELGLVMISQPIDTLENIKNAIQNTIIMFALAILGISLLFGIFSFLNFARPLSQLTQVTNDISAGNLDRTVKPGVPGFMLRDEITVLGENFNHMTARLRDLYSDLERKVEERTLELNNAVKELAIARDDALEANRTKSAFMANMSHELRTPLNAIIGYTNLLISGTYGTTNEKQIDRLQRVLDNGQHLLALINDVLDLSKIEAGKMELYLEDFDVTDLLDNVISTAQPLAERHQNELIKRYSVDMGIMHSDVTKVRQILFNLISNAAKFTEQGTITVYVREEVIDHKPGLQFDVVDSGIGMTQEQQEQIFQEFVQADISTTRKYGGTGLGLTITRRFCEMLGGTIEVNSIPGEGSTFSVWLPRQSRPLKSATGNVQKIETGTYEQIPAHRPVVLVIDDDEASLETIQYYLEQENYHVMTTNSGKDGLRIAKEFQPNVILLDVLMPGMDGWAVLNKLKKDPETAQIPVVMTTIISDRNMGYALGATDYITKPVDRNQVLSVVNRYRCINEPCPVLIVEDDLAARQMMRDMLETEGWQVMEASNGQKGLEILTHTQPQVILLDLMMPQMNGFEFLQLLRQNEKWSSIPVVVITAMDLAPHHYEELMASAQNIIQKGVYQPEDLLREVQYWASSTLE